MLREDTWIAEKIIKYFPDKNILFNKKFNVRKPDIWFKDFDEGDHEDYDTDDEKEREDMFKRHNFITIRCNLNDPVFDINNFLSEINSYVTKLRKKSGGWGD